jgi:hypothetical protein
MGLLEGEWDGDAVGPAVGEPVGLAEGECEEAFIGLVDGENFGLVAVASVIGHAVIPVEGAVSRKNVGRSVGDSASRALISIPTVGANVGWGVSLSVCSVDGMDVGLDVMKIRASVCTDTAGCMVGGSTNGISVAAGTAVGACESSMSMSIVSSSNVAVADGAVVGSGVIETRAAAGASVGGSVGSAVSAAADGMFVGTSVGFVVEDPVGCCVGDAVRDAVAVGWLAVVGGISVGARVDVATTTTDGSFVLESVGSTGTVLPVPVGAGVLDGDGAGVAVAVATTAGVVSSSNPSSNSDADICDDDDASSCSVREFRLGVGQAVIPVGGAVSRKKVGLLVGDFEETAFNLGAAIGANVVVIVAMVIGSSFAIEYWVRLNSCRSNPDEGDTCRRDGGGDGDERMATSSSSWCCCTDILLFASMSTSASVTTCTNTSSGDIDSGEPFVDFFFFVDFSVVFNFVFFDFVMAELLEDFVRTAKTPQQCWVEQQSPITATRMDTITARNRAWLRLPVHLHMFLLVCNGGALFSSGLFAIIISLSSWSLLFLSNMLAIAIVNVDGDVGRDDDSCSNDNVFLFRSSPWW